MDIRMLLTLDQIVARIVKSRWMRLAQDGDKTCEIVSVRMGRRCRKRKTHLYMQPTRQGMREGVPSLIAKLRHKSPLGPYTEDMVDKMMDDSVKFDFLIGMSSYELKQFIRDTASQEVYVYVYSRASVCKEIQWVDELYNINAGWLEAWNERNRCTRFCFSDERPVPARTSLGGPTGGALPARWKRVPMDESDPPGIARWTQLVRVKPPVKPRPTVWAHKIPRKPRVLVLDE